MLAALRQSGIAGDHHATLTRRNDLVAKEREGGNVAHGAYPATLVLSAVGLSGIFHDRKPMAPGNLQNRVHIDGVTV